ncbi:hypothetical protein Bbelb_073250 [Branchiostoma belcheri]|nr:hypothetical protein Bbelb_073250 [Branchiostoma belcheri]
MTPGLSTGNTRLMPNIRGVSGQCDWPSHNHLTNRAPGAEVAGTTSDHEAEHIDGLLKILATFTESCSTNTMEWPACSLLGRPASCYVTKYTPPLGRHTRPV